MTFATGAWAVWGVTIVLMELAPGWAPDWGLAIVLSSLFAFPGLLLALLTVRAKRSWLLVALVPILANAMLLVLPWVALHLREAGPA